MQVARVLGTEGVRRSAALIRRRSRSGCRPCTWQVRTSASTCPRAARHVEVAAAPALAGERH